MTVMLFPDPRMRSPTALGGFGVAFCDELNVALAELQNVLEQADAVGLYNDPAVVSGHKIYDDRSSFAVYANFLGDACHKDTLEVSTAAERIRTLIQQRAGMLIPPLRPDYKPPELFDVPLWAKIGGGLALGVVGLVAIGYITGQTASVVKLFKRSRTAGYRRRR
jgi:hypothetical protein